MHGSKYDGDLNVTKPSVPLNIDHASPIGMVVFTEQPVNPAQSLWWLCLLSTYFGEV